MMVKKLTVLVTKAKQNDKDALMEIINIFMPLIKKYSRKLSYDGAETDLIIIIIKLVKTCPVYNKSKLVEDKDIISYIHISVLHEYIRLSKKFAKLMKMEIELNEAIYLIQSNDNIEDIIITNELLDKLPAMQRTILKELFLIGTTQTALAKKLNLSRQSVNRNKSKALIKLKQYIEL